MNPNLARTSLSVCLSLSAALFFGACSDQKNEPTQSVPGTDAKPVPQGEVSDGTSGVVARVGDEVITFAQLNTMLNSSAIVGLSVPAVGTTERNQVRVALLDKMISANLLYLDALKQGVDKDPAYQADVTNFSNALLASLYRDRQLVGNIEITDEEVHAFHESAMAPGTELTDDVRMAIEASLRKEKFKAGTANMRQRVREGVDLVIEEGVLDAAIDEQRKDSDVMATMDGEVITWGQMKPVLLAINRKSELMSGGLGIDTTEERFEKLNKIIDNHIMARKAREAGLEQDPIYQSRLAEFRKTRLVNLHREDVIHELEPSDEEIRAYYADNRDRIAVRERRKVQMVVLKTREEAEDIKKRIEEGLLTIHQAAQDYSIDPNAKKTLGDMGWVTQGTGFPELDAETFALLPDELGGPVESPAGWHLVKVLDMRDPQLVSIEDENTRKVTRRMMIRERLNEYEVGLRKNDFTVAVYADQLDRAFKDEADWVIGLSEKAQQPASLTEQRVEELKKFMQQ